MLSTLALPRFDFGFRMRRGVEEALFWLARDRALATGVLILGVRKKLEGLRPSLAGVPELTPLERFAKSRGSTFSQLSISRNSAFRLGETLAAVELVPAYSSFLLGKMQSIPFCLFLRLVRDCRRAPSRGAKGWRVTAAIAPEGFNPRTESMRCDAVQMQE